MSVLPHAPADPARYRYGAVFLLTLVLLVFIILAPAADWSRAVALGLESTALVVALATSRTRERRTRATVIAVVGGVVVACVVAGLVPAWGTQALSGVLAVAIPLSLVRGLARLVGTAGATLQAVAGALAIYLLIGLMFAWLIGFVAHVGGAPYFASGTDGTESERVYYSLVVMTTTGFGEFTAGQPIGRALAVVEMLVGQLYLVTVIGVLIGSLVQRRGSSDPGDAR
jgi:hypothetical protein